MRANSLSDSRTISPSLRHQHETRVTLTSPNDLQEHQNGHQNHQPNNSHPERQESRIQNENLDKRHSVNDTHHHERHSANENHLHRHRKPQIHLGTHHRASLGYNLNLTQDKNTKTDKIEHLENAFYHF